MTEKKNKPEINRDYIQPPKGMDTVWKLRIWLKDKTGHDEYVSFHRRKPIPNMAFVSRFYRHQVEYDRRLIDIEEED